MPEKPRGLSFDSITTKTGDDGTSAIFSGERLPKDDAAFEALGDLDELKSILGLLRAEVLTAAQTGAAAGAARAAPAPLLESIQATLTKLLSLVATTPGSALYGKLAQVTEDDISRLEEAQRMLLDSTPISPEWINPGVNRAEATAHLCRTVARRTERRVVTVIRERNRTDLGPALRYLNRLSDLLFVIACGMR